MIVIHEVSFTTKITVTGTTIPEETGTEETEETGIEIGTTEDGIDDSCRQLCCELHRVPISIGHCCNNLINLLFGFSVESSML